MMIGEQSDGWTGVGFCAARFGRTNLPLIGTQLTIHGMVLPTGRSS